MFQKHIATLRPHAAAAAAAVRVQLTCVSLHQPFSNIGRMGLSTRRATNTSSSRGLPSRLRKEPLQFVNITSHSTAAAAAAQESVIWERYLKASLHLYNQAKAATTQHWCRLRHCCSH
jgi:hypothetical protein